MSSPVGVALDPSLTEDVVADEAQGAVADEAQIAVFSEKVVEYKDYTEAAKGACAWADQGKVKVDSSKLVLYERYEHLICMQTRSLSNFLFYFSKVGPYKGRIVGETLREYCLGE